MAIAQAPLLHGDYLTFVRASNSFVSDNAPSETLLADLLCNNCQPLRTAPRELRHYMLLDCLGYLDHWFRVELAWRRPFRARLELSCLAASQLELVAAHKCLLEHFGIVRLVSAWMHAHAATWNRINPSNKPERKAMFLCWIYNTRKSGGEHETGGRI